MFDNFIEMDEAAKLTGYSIHTLYKKVERGEIPFRKLGRRNIFLKDELLDWMNGSPLSRRPELKERAAELYDSLQRLRGLVEGMEAGGGLSADGARLLRELIDSCLFSARALAGRREFGAVGGTGSGAEDRNQVGEPRGEGDSQ